MKKLAQFLNKGILIFLGIYFVLWLYFAVRHSSLDYSNLGKVGLLFITLLLILSASYFFNKELFRNSLIILIAFLSKHKKALMILVFLFQILLILCVSTLAEADTRNIYNLTIGNPEAPASYISAHPNNFSLLVLYKIVNRIVGTNYLVFVLEIINVLCIDFSIILLTYTCGKYISKQVADITFLLFVFLYGFSPQHLSTYSDNIVLPIVSSILFFLLFIMHEEKLNKKIIAAVFLGIFFILGYTVRPPAIIPIIAFCIYLIIWQQTKIEKSSYKALLPIVLAFFISTGVSYFSYTVLINQQKFVEYDANKSRTMLYYMNLGLTFSGADHSDLPEEVYTAEGTDRNKAAFRDIQKRLKEYIPVTFAQHYLTKIDGITGEGMLGWKMESVLKEENLQRNPILDKLIDSNFAKKIRQFVYPDGYNYANYAFVIQFVWILMIIGLIFSVNYSQNKSDEIFKWLILSLFGSILFLLLFEGGRTRYLIQFLPTILIISGYGWQSYLEKKKG